MRRRILVVAKSPDVRTEIAMLLRSEGLSVTTASGTADAVSAIQAEAPDAAILVAADASDEASQQLRLRIYREVPGCRVALVRRVETFQKGENVVRYRLHDHVLSDRELLGFVTMSEDDPATSAPSDSGTEALIQTIDILIGLQELGDRFFAGSSHRASLLARAVAERLQLPPEAAREIALATLLRDVGKAGLDEALFDNSDEFDELQKLEMQKHVGESVRLIEHIEFPWKINTIIRHHHERYDGNGYPDGLRGPEIPMGSRIVAAVDSYVAMISRRAHRQALSGADALRELIRSAGSQLDPEIVEALINVVQEQNVLLNPDQTPIILIADKDVEFVKLLKMRLLNEGMEVRAVPTFQDVILELMKVQPQLVMAHVEPGDADVFDLYRSIQEDPDLRMVPFVITSPKLDRITRARALQSGMDDYIVKSEGMGEIVARIENILVREVVRRSTGVTQRMNGVSGQLEHLSLPDIVQMLNLGLKTARVTLTHEETEGKIWFESGQAVHAELGPIVGIDALHGMLRWNDGEFCIEHGISAGKRTIEVDTMFAVIEGVRIIDEEQGGEEAAGEERAA